MKQINDPEEYIDSNRGRLFHLLKKCVSIPTQNPPGNNYWEMANLFQKQLSVYGFENRVIRVPDRELKRILGTALYPRYIVLGRWNTNSKKTLHFNGHYDVVAPSVENSRIPPYSPLIEGDWLYGRGSSDMKGAIVAFIFAMKAVKECGIKPKTNIEISFTPDEEIGGELGAGYLCKSGFIHPDFVVIGEGGRLNELGYGHRGAVWMEVTVKGQAAHSMAPKKGINAFEQMSQLVFYLKKDTDKLLNQKNRIYITKGGIIVTPTLTMGGPFHGVANAIINTIPERATFSLDRRTTPTENLQQVEKEMKNLIIRAAKKARAKISISTIHKVKPTILQTENILFRTFSECIKRIKKESVKPTIGTGFNDLFHFALQFKIQGCCYGVFGENMHGLGERVNLDDLVKTSKVYAGLIRSLTPRNE
jgi:succinyl-diaminopimelate desuccinylase